MCDCPPEVRSQLKSAVLRLAHIELCHAHHSCAQCAKRVSADHFIRVHYKSTHDITIKDFKCPYGCGNDFPNLKSMGRHIAVKHLDKMPKAKCPDEDCDQEFEDYDLMHSHYAAEHEIWQGGATCIENLPGLPQVE